MAPSHDLSMPTSSTRASVHLEMLCLLLAFSVGCRVMDARSIPSSEQVRHNDTAISASRPVLGENLARNSMTTSARLVAYSSDENNAQLTKHPEVQQPAPLTGQETIPSPSANKSLEFYLQRALESHPKVLAARARVSVAQYRVTQATSLADPMVETMFWPIEANAQQLASGRMTNQLDFSQEVPLPEKLRTRGAIADREVQVALAESTKVQREISESVRIAYYELWFATRAMEIIANNRAVASELVRVAEARYQAEGSQQDVIRAELEVEKLDQKLLELGQQEAAAQAELAALIQDPTATDIGVETNLPIQNLPDQFDQLISQAEQCNPELQGLAWQIERDRENQRLACLQRYPDFKLGMQYGMMTTDGAISPQADGIDNISFSAGITLPVWRQKIQAGICEASAQRLSSTRLFEAEQLTIAGNLRRLFAEVNLLAQQRSLFVDRIVPKAEQALDVAMAEYTVGKTTFAQVVDDYTEVLTYRLESARLDAALATSLARLQRTIGCD